MSASQDLPPLPEWPYIMVGAGGVKEWVPKHHAEKAMRDYAMTTLARADRVPDPVRQVVRLASELCDAVDAAEDDVGGHRSVKDILGELGPMCDLARECL